MATFHLKKKSLKSTQNIAETNAQRKLEMWKTIKDMFKRFFGRKSRMKQDKNLVAGKKQFTYEIPDWLKLADTQLGVKEIYGIDHNETILEYHSHTVLKATDDETPWCSAFVCWVFESLGVHSTKNAAARSWLGWGENINSPRYGCVVILSRGNSAWQGHVGFYMGHTGSKIRVLGGNQNNEVSIENYDESRVLGYRWPVV